ncbi:DNA cytosine methyltransferase [Streptomyces europaeiscabiei]|uniref:DNA cytosine methyltransferase n=1 Tax=Streptomyces europaeiscabiei TaxID=146819 RepID=UPI002E29151B|nr:DNA cytosine methyltransferase [Streptomyces europaeiscabiei]
MTLGDHELRPAAPFTVLDLFAGCGGFSEGFRSYALGQDTHQPRFRSVAAVELDRSAAATYEANHQPDLLFCGDIANFDPRPLEGSVDVIAGGPPCQGFSGLGRGSGNDPRNELWKEYLRVVTVVRPKVFVMENVDRFATSPEFALLKDEARPGGVLRDYHVHAQVLNAADYGVSQARKRTIVFGSRRDLGEYVNHPVPTHAKEPFGAEGLVLFGAEKTLEPWRPVSTVFQRSDRMEIRGIHLPEGRSSHGVPGPYRTDELHFGRTPTGLSMARYKAIPPGGNRLDLTDKWSEDGQYLSTESWDSHRSGSGDVMGRLHADRPSVTIRTEFFKPEKGRYLHPSEHRPITHYEAALIQGFPDDYRWYGSKSDIARQIGNAVPVGLGCALAGAIYERLAAGAYGEAV